MISEVEGARVRRFRMPRVRVPGTATVQVEIGRSAEELSRGPRVYPRYRVLVDGAVIDWDAGMQDSQDWSLPVGTDHLSVDAALDLLWHSTCGEHTASRTWLADWVEQRRKARASLRAVGAVDGVHLVVPVDGAALVW